MLQTLDDAEALLFLEKNFEEMFNRMPADEVATVCKRELSRLSQVSDRGGGEGRGGQGGSLMPVAHVSCRCCKEFAHQQLVSDSFQ
jgi:hypothetical protein